MKVYERLSPPSNPAGEMVWGDVATFYLIGLGERGQAGSGSLVCGTASMRLSFAKGSVFFVVPSSLKLGIWSV